MIKLKFVGVGPLSWHSKIDFPFLTIKGTSIWIDLNLSGNIVSGNKKEEDKEDEEDEVRDKKRKRPSRYNMPRKMKLRFNSSVQHQQYLFSIL